MDAVTDVKLFSTKTFSVSVKVEAFLKKITSNKEEGGDTVKNMIKILVIALTGLAFSGVSFAQGKPATPAPEMEKKSEMKSEKAKTNDLTGEVTSVDAKAGTLTVKAKDKESKLTADSKRTKAALEKLKVGDMVKVSYTEKDGKMIVSSVKAESKKSDKSMEKKDEMMEKKSKTK
jgi:Cu/Ag efflux protein CusF